MLNKKLQKYFVLAPNPKDDLGFWRLDLSPVQPRNNKLKNGRNLKNYRGGKVYIRPSMTRKQRELQKEMIDQAKHKEDLKESQSKSELISTVTRTILILSILKN